MANMFARSRCQILVMRFAQCLVDSTRSPEVGAVSIPVPQRKKLSHREVESPTEGVINANDIPPSLIKSGFCRC